MVKKVSLCDFPPEGVQACVCLCACVGTWVCTWSTLSRGLFELTCPQVSALGSLAV